jgi:hypothetical protein
MVIKWIKRIIWLILAYVVWKGEGIGIAILFLFLTIIFDFMVLLITAKLAIKGFQEGDSPEEIEKAKNRFFEYQRNPLSPSKRLVTFAQMILAPVGSIIIPFIIAGVFLGWFF